MTSDLGHSVPDNAAPSLLSPKQQIGAHILTTTLCLDLIDRELLNTTLATQTLSGTNAFSFLSKSLSFFKENIDLLDVILNREAIYVAAQIVGVDEADIDTHSARLWPSYESIQVAVHSMVDGNRALPEALGNHVVGVTSEEENIRYQIFVDGIQMAS